MEKSVSPIDEFGIRNSIRLLIGGYLYDGGDIENVPKILQEIADKYKNTIDEVV